MSTLQQAMARAGLVTASAAEEESELQLFRSLMRQQFEREQYNANLRRKTEQHFAKARENNRGQNAPRVMGIRPQLDPTDARIADAAGSDAGKNYKIGGPALKFGWTGRQSKESDTRRPMERDVRPFEDPRLKEAPRSYKTKERYSQDVLKHLEKIGK